MRDQVIISRMHQGLFIGFLLLVLGLNSSFSAAAPLLQGTETATATATVDDRATATQAPLPNAIEGYVFEDLNGDQEKQANEPGIGDVTLTLQTVPGLTTVATTETDAATGYFSFATGTVPPGSYRLVQELIPGYETTGGQERYITVNVNSVTVVYFANVEQQATATTVSTSPTATATSVIIRETPTSGPTFTSTPSPTLSPTTTLSPTPTLSPTSTVSPSPTTTVSATATTTATPTATTTATRTATATATVTLRSLTPIATFITTTPGVLVTTTPFPGTPVDRLPDTGSGSNLLLVATALGLLMIGTGLARRLFFSR